MLLTFSLFLVMPIRTLFPDLTHFNVDFSIQNYHFLSILRQFIMKDLPSIRATHSGHLSHWNPIACNLITPSWSSLLSEFLTGLKP